MELLTMNITIMKRKWNMDTLVNDVNWKCNVLKNGIDSMYHVWNLNVWKLAIEIEYVKSQWLMFKNLTVNGNWYWRVYGLCHEFEM